MPWRRRREAAPHAAFFVDAFARYYTPAVFACSPFFPPSFPRCFWAARGWNPYIPRWLCSLSAARAPWSFPPPVSIVSGMAAATPLWHSDPKGGMFPSRADSTGWLWIKPEPLPMANPARPTLFSQGKEKNAPEAGGQSCRAFRPSRLQSHRAGREGIRCPAAPRWRILPLFPVREQAASSTEKVVHGQPQDGWNP